jgi:hypothetical protein
MKQHLKNLFWLILLVVLANALFSTNRGGRAPVSATPAKAAEPAPTPTETTPDWQEGDRVMLSARRTFACTSAPVFREFYRIASARRDADALQFGTAYCQISVWVPIPLIVMYSDDFSGERNPGVCVRQMNWRDCYWIAREQLVPFDPRAVRP